MREKNWLEQEQALRKMKWNAANMNEEWIDVLDVLDEIDEEVRMPIVLNIITDIHIRKLEK